MGLNIIQSVIYTSDFGFQDTLNFKITDGAPIPTGYYSAKVDVACGAGSSGYKMRNIVATFPPTSTFPGGKFQYPVPLRTGTRGIEALANALIGLGAICLDLEGEQWANVTNRALAASPSYRSTPYTLSLGKAKKTYQFSYTSDLTGKNESVRKSFETNNADLLAAQIGCLTAAGEVESSGICSITSLGIKPRAFGLKGLATKAGNSVITATVNRQVIVSGATEALIRTCGSDTAPKAFCLTYKGESAKNIQNLVAATSATP